ncbi:lytic transglycosylase domain-containing protein [Methylorubrum extorquens]
MLRSLLPLGLACLSSVADAQPASMVLANASGLASFSEGTKSRPPEQSARATYLSIIQREAASAGLPFEIADAVAQIESGYNPAAIGGVGEIGLMQVRPTTAAMLGFKGSAAELAQPEVNIRYGVRYLAEAWRLSNGDLCRALMKYRAGHGSETMSPLSVTYCSRAQSVLKIPEAMRGLQAAPVPSSPRSASPSLARTPLPKGLKRGTPEFEKAYWAAHEARITKLKAQVHADWRARGAKAI